MNQTRVRILAIILLLGALVLAACTPTDSVDTGEAGSAPALTNSATTTETDIVDAPTTEVVGTVESIEGSTIVVSGQSITIDDTVVLTDVQVGDTVSAQVAVSDDGSVRLTGFTFIRDSANDNDANDNSANDNMNDNNDDNMNDNDANDNDANDNDANDNSANDNDANDNDANDNSANDNSANDNSNDNHDDDDDDHGNNDNSNDNHDDDDDGDHGNNDNDNNDNDSNGNGNDNDNSNG